jgi:hypothetical protein
MQHSQAICKCGLIIPAFPVPSCLPNSHRPRGCPSVASARRGALPRLSPGNVRPIPNKEVFSRASKLLLLNVLAVLSPAQAKPNVVMLMTDRNVSTTLIQPGLKFRLGSLRF